MTVKLNIQLIQLNIQKNSTKYKCIRMCRELSLSRYIIADLSCLVLISLNSFILGSMINCNMISLKALYHHKH